MRKLQLLLRFLAGSSLALSLASAARCQEISIDTTSARAVLKALHDPHLAYSQAMDIAQLEGNQGMIRKVRELGEAETDEQFAHALVAAAQDQPAGSPQERSYNFAQVKSSTAAISLLLDRMEHGFDDVVRARISLFLRKPGAFSLRGFAVAGGDGGGYAFGGSDFFVNMAMNDDILMLQQVSTHEAFHGVQGALYHEDTERWTHGMMRPDDRIRGNFCSHAAALFMNLLNEGTAMYVGSDELLKDSQGATGKRLYAEWIYGSQHLSDSAALLEVSVASMQAPRPVPYKLVYQVDFYGKGVAYFIGSAMTQAIAEKDGRYAIGEMIQQPGYGFVLRYTRLKSYGKDGAHPRLGENAVRAAQLLHDGCPAS